MCFIVQDASRAAITSVMLCANVNEQPYLRAAVHAGLLESVR